MNKNYQNKNYHNSAGDSMGYAIGQEEQFRSWFVANTPEWMLRVRKSLYDAIGGLPGKRSLQRAGFFTPLRLALLCAIITMAFAWIGKQGCIQQQIVNGHAELITSGNRPFVAMCYSDIIVQFDKLDGFSASFPFDSNKKWDEWSAMSAPLVKVLIYILVKISAVLYPFFNHIGLPVGLSIAFYFGVCGVFFALLWLGVIAMVLNLLVRGKFYSRLSIYLVALSPIAIIHVLTNFDIVPVFFTTLGLWCYARGYPKLAGVVLGCGTLTSLSCAVALLAALIMSLRKLDIQKYLTVVAFGALTIISEAIIFILWDGDSFLDSYVPFWRSHEDIDSLYAAMQNIFHYTNFDAENRYLYINTIIVVMIVAVILWVIVVLIQSVHCDIYQVTLLLTACFLVTGKMFKPQFSLWLLPLLVLGLRRPKLIMVWMIIDALTWFPRMGTLLGFYDAKGLPLDLYGFIALIRIFLLFIVVIITAMDMLGVDIRYIDSRVRVVHHRFGILEDTR